VLETRTLQSRPRSASAETMQRCKSKDEKYHPSATSYNLSNHVEVQTMCSSDVPILLTGSHIAYGLPPLDCSDSRNSRNSSDRHFLAQASYRRCRNLPASGICPRIFGIKIPTCISFAIGTLTFIFHIRTFHLFLRKF
jgi:hypothetical protein